MTRNVLLPLFLSLCFAIGVTTSCGKSATPEKEPVTQPPLVTADSVAAVYSLYVRKDYADYVDEMLSCDGKPASYRQQMATLLEQHAAERSEKEGNVANFEVRSIKPQAEGRAAEVYLNVTYAGGNTEEIQLQFIHDGKRWRLR